MPNPRHSLRLIGRSPIPSTWNWTPPQLSKPSVSPLSTFTSRSPSTRSIRPRSFSSVLLVDRTFGPASRSGIRPACLPFEGLGISSRRSIVVRSKRPNFGISRIPIAAASVGRRTIFIQTESTPNVDALKFKPNSRVLPTDLPAPFLEYLTARSTVAPPYPSPLAAALLSVDGVATVFFGLDYITVMKRPDVNWQHVKPEVFSLITEYVTSGKPMVSVSESGSTISAVGSKDGDDGNVGVDSLVVTEEDDEVVGMIKELLETRIRPTIQEDGGDIDFRGFADGIVMLKLRGACRTCDSSSLTLKRGIEAMLMHYIEEVKGVEQVMDPEEEVAIKEFAKFEEKLRAQRGYEA